VEALVREEARLSRWDFFVVLDEAELRSVTTSEKLYPDSALLLGALYERSGLYDDAEREFYRLAELNPMSPLPGKMLASLRQLRQSP
jgi:Flp pilus assembly protein TadD